MKKAIINKWTVVFSVLVLLFSIAACKKEPVVSMVSDQMNITTYLDKHPEQFSEFRKILELTNAAGFLQAYGNYTLFLPSNDGVKKYLTDMGKSSVEQLDAEELKSIVRFHLIEDTVSTTKFGDGKLTVPTMLGQYLITGASNVGGVTTTTVNRQANIEESNIRLGNGYVHVIDNVLRFSKFTLAQLIEANPNFSIFTQALRETGLYDTLNILPASNLDTAKKYLTVLAETDQVLAAAGYTSYAALKAKYDVNDVSDLKDHRNGLHAFMAYHILFEARYLADIASQQAHPTLSRPEIITTQLVNEQVLVNDVTFNEVYEPGFLLSRAESDNSASNGVLHTTASYAPATGLPTTGHFAIKKREPFPVYWDVADFPESRAHPNFRKSGAASFDFRKTSKTSASPLKGWDWGSQIYGPNYVNAGGSDAYVNADYLNLPFGVKSRNDWMTAKTPLIVRGSYYVWVCYRKQLQSKTPWPNNVGTKARILIDDVPLPKTFFFGEPTPPGSTAELTALGWKYYTSTGNAAAPFVKSTYDASGNSNNNPWVAKNLGVIEISSTDVHTMKLEALIGSQSTNNLDMVHFIPVKHASQILPRFKKDGTEDWEDYPGTH